MKKLIMLMVAVLALSSAATAQSMRVDVEGLKKKTAASDTDIQDSKKNGRAATWMNRGKVYFDAAVAPTNGLRRGMEQLELGLLFREPQSRQDGVESRGGSYSVLEYPHFNVYIAQNQVVFWEQKTFIVENGLETSVEAYQKAVELDARQTAKAKQGVESVIAQFRQEADVSFSQGNYAATAKAFAKAYDYSVLPLVNEPDSLSAYNAGYVGVLAEDFNLAIKYLDEAYRLAYEMDGELYFLLYHTYMGIEQPEKAESALKEGVQKFPANSKLIESLIIYYTSTGQDATQMIPLVEDALQRDPDNYVFHFGLGLIYDKLENHDNAILQFQKASELNPQDFSSVFNLAITYVRKAEALLPEINAIPRNEQARYEEMLGTLNGYYKTALPFFERAYELSPTEPNSVELLKNIYFRFRDESPEMMQSYEKYNELWKTM